MEPKTPLGRILHDKGQRQTWLAERLNVDPSSVSRWVRGLRPIPEHHLPRIAEELGVETRTLRGTA